MSFVKLPLKYRQVEFKCVTHSLINQRSQEVGQGFEQLSLLHLGRGWMYILFNTGSLLGATSQHQNLATLVGKMKIVGRSLGYASYEEYARTTLANVPLLCFQKKKKSDTKWKTKLYLWFTKEFWFDLPLDSSARKLRQNIKQEIQTQFHNCEGSTLQSRERGGKDQNRNIGLKWQCANKIYIHIKSTMHLKSAEC